mmetsp:Transcript_22923/g.28116  ORF Transcript_22923/g.28116 Transcript_22923/m.28116 type:complete len:336 (+) Transcript_22923:28-1035(+)
MSTEIEKPVQVSAAPAGDAEVQADASDVYKVNRAEDKDHFGKMLTLLSALMIGGVLVYNLWVLFSIVAWVSHLGYRVPQLSRFLCARGFPGNQSVEGLANFFKVNIPAALGFVLPHSFLRPPTLRKWVGNRFARIVYCTIASLSLHCFIHVFRPLETQVLFILPFSSVIQQILSVVMLGFALTCFLSDYRTYLILGVPQAVWGTESQYSKFPPGLSARMDIITWMGITVWNIAGGVGFILFSGISILPYEVTITDVLVRVIAALYLRARSQGFRMWVDQIESIHHTIWFLRALILFGALKTGASSMSGPTVATTVFGATCVAILLNRFEKINKPK